jgi:integrase
VYRGEVRNPPEKAGERSKKLWPPSLKNVNPKIVSEMLGHANIAITLDTYSHVLPNMQHSAVAAMEEAFS